MKKQNFISQSKLPSLRLAMAAFFLGLLTMYGAMAYFHKQDSKKLQTFADLLVKVKGASTGGVTKEEWALLTRETSIAADQYKISDSPSKIEIEKINKIVSEMMNVRDAWKPLSNCGYYGKKEDCAKEYADRLYNMDYPVLNPKYLLDTDNENPMLSKSVYTPYDVYKIALADEVLKQGFEKHRSSVVSLYLSITSNSVEDFFKFHGISL